MLSGVQWSGYQGSPSEIGWVNRDWMVFSVSNVTSVNSSLNTLIPSSSVCQKQAQIRARLEEFIMWIPARGPRDLDVRHMKVSPRSCRTSRRGWSAGVTAPLQMSEGGDTANRICIWNLGTKKMMAGSKLSRVIINNTALSMYVSGVR